MIGITNPPLEHGHNWRQSLTNMVARNFVEHDANMLYPTIDTAGDRTGIMGTEFPLLNFLIYLVSIPFDYEHWYGRLINLIVSSLGVLYFYKLLKGLFTERLAFLSTMILCTSIWFGYSRKIMPDTFSISLMIMGLYYATDYLRSQRWLSLLLFFVFATLGTLCKIPALNLFAGLAVILFIQEIPLNRKIVLIGTGSLSFGIACLWYFYWVPYLVETYHSPLFFPHGLLEGLEDIVRLMGLALSRFYFSSLKSYLAFACFLVGLYFLWRKGDWPTRIVFTVITLVFCVFAIKTGATFPEHSYYIIPYTPLMAFVAAYFLNRIPAKYAYGLLAIIAVEAMANQQHDFFIKDDQLYKLELESIVDAHVPAGEKIVINGGKSPQLMYFAHRKGWSVFSEALAEPSTLDSVQAQGAKFLVIDRDKFQQKLPEHTELYDDEQFAIYKLKQISP